MDVKNKLFHGINLGNYGEYIGSLKATDVLEQILESGTIYTREELYKKRKELYCFLNNFYGQKNNEVCVALHPDNTNFTERYLLAGTTSGLEAFGSFVEKNISLILNERILNDKQYTTKGMYGEIRVQNSISLDYLDGIGYYDKIDFAINELKKILDSCDKIGYKRIRFDPGIRELMNIENLSEYINQEKQKYFKIKNLIEKYNYSVTMVDSYSGQPIEENIVLEIEKASEIREKIKEMIR